MGVNGVLGVPGKLLPIDDGVLGIEPEKLRGGLKSVIGVGGGDLAGDPTASLSSSSQPSVDRGLDGPPLSGELSISPIAEGEVRAPSAIGGEAATSVSLLLDRAGEGDGRPAAGELGGGCS